MKINLKRFAVIFLSFFILTLLVTQTLGSASDGNDLIGFPFTFYTYLGGKRYPEPATQHLLEIGPLMADIVIILAASFIGEIIFRKKAAPNIT